jgi:hypothetical protein
MAIELGGTSVAGCCAILSLTSFWWDEKEKSDAFNKKKKAEMVKELLDFIPQARRIGKSIIFGTICTDQLLAEEALIEAGYTCCSEDWIYRDPTTSNYKTGVKMYWKSVYQPEVVEVTNVTA